MSPRTAANMSERSGVAPTQRRKPLAGGRGQRGAILPAVLVLSLVAVVVSMTLMSRVQESSDSTAELVKRKRAFYAVDGMGRITIEQIKRFMMEDGDPSTEELQDPNLVAPPVVPGYSLERYELTSMGTAIEAPISGGSFDGLNARQKPVSIRLRARDLASNTAAEVNLMVNLAQISMFQYFVFSSGYLDLFPGPNMTINPGRVHANGDVCIGSDNRLQIEHVTSASRLLVSDARCRRNAGSGAYVSDGSAYHFINGTTSNGCTNCAGSGMDWREYSETVFRGHIKDVAHGTPALRLPLSNGPAQGGTNAAGNIVPNSQSIRLLVDPVQPGDDDAMLEQRFAWKADIRILNGVWYVNDGTWPGKPIWSDQPGQYVTQNAEHIEGTPTGVGQENLHTARAWPSVPKRFSYYEYDATAQTLTSDQSGVISYGVLNYNASGEYRPGFWVRGANGQTFTDVDGKSKRSFCSHCSSGGCNTPLNLYDASATLCQGDASTGYVSLLDAQRLQGTLGGFIDHRVRAADTTRGPILPINFDVAEFTRAMQDTTSGELGSYFSGGTGFNGIVYISGTWNGSMAGVPDTLATLWPAQGAVTDSTQIASFSTPMNQRALPQPLCSDSLGYVPGTRRIGFSRPVSDGVDANGFEPAFTIPSCDSSISPLATPNAVRIVNAASISASLFPKGLSIITNLPAYVQGPFNTSSPPTLPVARCGGAGTTWIPVLVGADAVTLLSSAWRDQNDPWDNSSGFGARRAVSTAFYASFISGNVETVDGSNYSGGIENFPRFLENWNGNTTATISGALVVGFASVYQRQRWGAGNVYSAPVRAWSFDTHLELMSCQPPGTPMFNVHAFTYLEEQALDGG